MNKFIESKRRMSDKSRECNVPRKVGNFDIFDAAKELNRWSWRNRRLNSERCEDRIVIRRRDCRRSDIRRQSRVRMSDDQVKCVLMSVSRKVNML